MHTCIGSSETDPSHDCIDLPHLLTGGGNIMMNIDGHLLYCGRPDRTSQAANRSSRFREDSRAGWPTQIVGIHSIGPSYRAHI